MADHGGATVNPRPVNGTRPNLHESTRRYVADREIARGYDRHFAGQELFVYDAAVLDEWFKQPGRLIDLGCGTGRHVVQFARRGFDVVGVDLSGEMLAETQAKLERADLTATLVRADICRLPLIEAGGGTKGDESEGDRVVTDTTAAMLWESGCFDYALCMFSTLGLVFGRENRLGFLRRVHRLLKPAGQFALHVHNRGFSIWRHEGRMFLLTNFVQARLGQAERGDKFLRSYRGIRKMYLHIFTEGEVRDLLAEAGFEILEVVALDRRRRGPLQGWLGRAGRRVLANGFIIRAGKSERRL